MVCAWSPEQGGFPSYFTEGRLILGIGPIMGIGPNGYWTKWALDQMGIGPNAHWTKWVLDQVPTHLVQYTFGPTWTKWVVDHMGLAQLGLDEMGIGRNRFRRNGNKPLIVVKFVSDFGNFEFCPFLTSS